MLNRTGSATVKYTAVLPRDCIEELRTMAEKKVIPSVNQGIRIAVEAFVKAQRLKEYQRMIQESASDEAFINRTMETHRAFEAADAEVDKQW